MPGEFDATTQHYGKPLWASQQLKRETEAINELFRRRAKNKYGKINFKKNEKAEYLDKDGNVISLPDIEKELEVINKKSFKPISLDEFIKEAGLKETTNKGHYYFPKHKMRAGTLAYFTPDELKQMIEWETTGTTPKQFPNIGMSYVQNGFLPPSLLEAKKLTQAEKEAEINQEVANFNRSGLQLGAVPNEEYTPYQRYTGERIQGFSPAQEELLAEANTLPDYIDSLGHKNLEKTLNPGSQTQEILDSSKQFMMPYQDLFKSWEQQAADQFKERMKNEFDPRFISSGTWGSGGHRNFLQKALVENQKNLNHAKIEHLLKAQERAQDKGAHAYEARQQDLNTLFNEEGNVFKKRLASLGVREGMQKQKQELGQRNKDIEYQEALKEKEHPIRMTQIMSDLSSGVAHHVPSEVTTMNMGTNPAVSQPSTNTVNAALGLQAAGMLGKYGAQGGFKEGGAVYKKYASGGDITSRMAPFSQQSYLGPDKSGQNKAISPLDLVKSKVNKNASQGHSHGIMDLFANAPLEMNRPRPTDDDIGINTPEINKIRQHATNLENTPHTPFWDALGAFGAGMLGSGGKNTNEMLMGGGPKSLEAFNKAYSDKEARGDKIANLNSAIQDTRQVQMDREMNYRHQKDHLNIDRIKANAAERKSAREHAFHLEESKFKRDLEERKLKQKEEFESAKLSHEKPVKLDPVDKAILEDSALMLKNAPELKRDLDRLSELSKRIDSGGVTRKASPYWSSFPGGQGNQADLEEFDKLSMDLVGKATRLFGQRGGAKIAEMIGKSKPTREISREGNLRNAETLSEGIDRDTERSDFIIEAVTDYKIAPKKAALIYSKYEQEAKKNPNATPWKEIEPTHEFENRHFKHLERLSLENPKRVKEMYKSGDLTADDINAIANIADMRNKKKAA